jgi:hypothetical protein
MAARVSRAVSDVRHQFVNGDAGTVSVDAVIFQALPEH